MTETPADRNTAVRRALRTVLIGAGHIARQHLDCLRALPGVEVAAICDLAPSAAECAAERFHVPMWFTDHRRMLRDVTPDVVHIATPPTSHHALAMDSLDAGCHVIVEKPATRTLEELDALVRRAREKSRVLVEDYNYAFNRGPRAILRRVESGEFGAVIHVDVVICLDIVRTDGFADPNSPHPSLALAGGAIADFLPHLASLAHLFVGPHRRAHSVWTKRRPSVLPYDEFRALVDAEGGGTAALGFSASAQPDGFWLRVLGERMQATANLFTQRLTFDTLRPGPKPLGPVLNGLDEARTVRRAAIRNIIGKFRGGPGAYEGLFELLGRVYRSLRNGSDLPVTERQVLEVNRLVDALKPVPRT